MAAYAMAAENRASRAGPIYFVARIGDAAVSEYRD
jgi:hypothetical protein